MDEAIATLKSQFVHLVEDIKVNVSRTVTETVCREIDTRTDELFDIFVEKLRKGTINLNGSLTNSSHSSQSLVESTSGQAPVTGQGATGPTAVGPHPRSEMSPNVNNKKQTVLSSRGKTKTSLPPPQQPSPAAASKQPLKDIVKNEILDDDEVERFVYTEELFSNLEPWPCEPGCRCDRCDQSENEPIPAPPKAKKPKIIHLGSPSVIPYLRNRSMSKSITTFHPGSSSTPAGVSKVKLLARISPATAVQQENRNGGKQSSTRPAFRADQFFKIVYLHCLVDGCAATFPNPHQLNQHMSGVHSILEHRCLQPGCDQSFGSSNDLDEHLVYSHPRLQLACSKCGVDTPNHLDLIWHDVLYHQTGEFTCPSSRCNILAMTRQELLEHSKEKHQLTVPKPALEQNRECYYPGCKKTFRDNERLRRHQRTHSGARPYRCKWPDCEHDAIRRDHLVTHIKLVHFNLKKNERGEGIDLKQYVEVIRELL